MEKNEKLSFDLQEAFNELDELWDEEEEVVEESVNNSEFQKEAEENSELATEHHSENLTLNEAAEEEFDDFELAMSDEGVEKVNEPFEGEDNQEEAEEEAETAVETVEDFINELKEYDSKLVFEIRPIEIEGKEYAVESISFNDEDGKVFANINFVEKAAEDHAEEEQVEEVVEEQPEELEAEEVTE